MRGCCQGRTAPRQSRHGPDNRDGPDLPCCSGARAPGPGRGPSRSAAAATDGPALASASGEANRHHGPVDGRLESRRPQLIEVRLIRFRLVSSPLI